jgi:hypothetical protein
MAQYRHMNFVLATHGDTDAGEADMLDDNTDCGRVFSLLTRCPASASTISLRVRRICP